MVLDDTEFEFFRDLLNDNYGFKLSENSRKQIEHKVTRILLRRPGWDAHRFINHVRADRSGQAMAEVLNYFTTNYTFFFREKFHHDFLDAHVFPKALNQRRVPRIWSAGCSSGEEPYSIAIQYLEFLFKHEVPLQSLSAEPVILATDISEDVLKKALAGRFTNRALHGMARHLQHRYMPKNNDGFCITDQVKALILFKRLNLFSEIFPIKTKFDVIFCRNVFLYFQERRIRILLDRFVHFLKPGGYLFTSQTESIKHLKPKELEFVEPGIYRRL